MNLEMSEKGSGLLEFETKTVESHGLLTSDALLRVRPEVINLLMRFQVSCTSRPGLS